MQSAEKRSHMENPRANVAAQRRRRNGRGVVLFPLPLQGHINPMLQLANLLYSKGFTITILHTHFNSPNSSNHPNFTFHSIPDGLSESEASTDDTLAFLTLLNVNCVAHFRDGQDLQLISNRRRSLSENCLAKFLSDSPEEDEPIACIITDAVWHFTQAVADTFKLPRIVLRPSNVSSFLVFASLPLLREQGYLPIQESRLEEAVSNLPPLKVKDIAFIKTRNPEGFYGLISSMVKEIKGSSGLIWNSVEELEPSEMIKLGRDFPIPLFPIGPFHSYFPASSSSLLTQDQSCLSWLNTQAPKSVLYVSFGSLAKFNETEF